MPITWGKSCILVFASLSLGACTSWGTFWDVAPTTPPNEYLFVPGSYSRHTYRYVPASNTFAAGPDLTGDVQIGANAFNISSGIHAGKILIIHAATTSLTSIYDPQSRSMIAGPDLGINADIYSHNFLIPTGPHAGKTMIIPGQTTSTRIYDPETNTFGAGPVLNNAGRITLPITSGMHPGKFLMVSVSTSDLYDPATNNIIAGPTPGMPMTSNGTNVFPIRSGPHAGRFAFVRGGGGTLVTIYDPVGNSFPATLNLTSGANDGSQSFNISRGPLAGTTMIVHSDWATSATLYQESSNMMTTQDIGAEVPYGLTSFDLVAGPYAGKRLLTLGYYSATRLFDYATGTFSEGPNVPENVGGGGFWMPLP